MARRRAGAAPGLMGRVRWANVGRLAALLAAGLLILVGPPRGCGPSSAEPPVVAAPGPLPPAAEPRAARGTRPRRAPRRRPVRRHRPARAAAPAPPPVVRAAQPVPP